MEHSTTPWRWLPRSREMRMQFGVLGVVLAVLFWGALARPETASFSPADDALILAHVPIREARAPIQSDGRQGDLRGVLADAQHELELARSDGDPRHLGRAEALLSPWLEAAPGQRAHEVGLLYATILQSRHEFDAALRELDSVVARAPTDAQAWLTRASVLLVMGRVSAAAASCAQLTLLLPGSVATACEAQVVALQGRAASAIARLEAARASERDESRLAWLSSLHGELLYWYGDRRERDAERSLLAALTRAPDDRYTRGLYADLLLDQGRKAEVRKLVRGYEADDALLLRAVLASEGTAKAQLAEQLSQRFHESRLRGDSVHQREEARLLLALGDAQQALERASEGFAQQRELWDARVVLEAAHAAYRPEAAASVRSFLAETGCRSPRLAALEGSLTRAEAP